MPFVPTLPGTSCDQGSPRLESLILGSLKGERRVSECQISAVSPVFLSAPHPSRASVILEYSLTTLATCADAAGFRSQRPLWPTQGQAMGRELNLCSTLAIHLLCPPAVSLHHTCLLPRGLSHFGGVFKVFFRSVIPSASVAFLGYIWVQGDRKLVDILPWQK